MLFFTILFGIGSNRVARANRAENGQLMDVKGILSELRSEREQIEQDILALERGGPLRVVDAEVNPVAEVGRVGDRRRVRGFRPARFFSGKWFSAGKGLAQT